MGAITGAYKDGVIMNTITKVPKCISGHAVIESAFFMTNLCMDIAPKPHLKNSFRGNIENYGEEVL